jgi:tRNA A-37 threonylcarbamoyl transferase component Bud32
LTSREEADQQALEIYDQHPNLVARIETTEGPVVVKWFGWRHRMHVVLSPFRASRAWRSWKTAKALEQVGAFTPSPLFVYTRRCLGFVRENYLITAAIHPHQRLRVLLKSDAPVEFMEGVVSELALFIARMHNGGVLHRDLTSGNFLVDEVGQVYLTDLNRARHKDRITISQRLKDLARISFSAKNATLTSRLVQTFFRIYGTETSEEVNWEEEYWNYRQRRLKKRRQKLRLKRFLAR